MTLRRQLSIVALVYVIEGFPMGLFQGVFGVYLADRGVGLAAGGALGWLGLAWSIKALWSPLVERFGSRQAWIAGPLLAMAGALAAIAWLPSNPVGFALWSALAVFCLASATQDIAIDAYTIGLVDRGREGPANAVRMACYRVGFVLAGSGLPLVAGGFGWPAAFLVGSAASAVFAGAALATPRVPLPPPAERRPLHALADWARRPGLFAVLGFVLLYRVGDRAMGPMIPFFWIDRGFSVADFAVYNNALGAIATVLGAFAGGALVARRGILASLWVTGAAAVGSNLLYAAVALWPEAGRLGVYAAGVIESFSSGAVGAAFISYLMRICEKRHAAVQYASLTGLYALAGSLLAGASGWITELTGFAGYFALTAGFAVPAFVLLPRAATWMRPADAPED